MHKRSCFWKHVCIQCVNDSKKLLETAEKYFYFTFLSVWTKLSKKKPFLVRSEILGLHVNTLTANGEYFRRNRENLPLPIQMQLFKKPKRFCCFIIWNFWNSWRFWILFKKIFMEIFEIYMNFWTFLKKKPQSLSISEIVDSERRVCLRKYDTITVRIALRTVATAI